MKAFAKIVPFLTAFCAAVFNVVIKTETAHFVYSFCAAIIINLLFMIESTANDRNNNRIVSGEFSLLLMICFISSLLDQSYPYSIYAFTAFLLYQLISHSMFDQKITFFRGIMISLISILVIFFITSKFNFKLQAIKYSIIGDTAVDEKHVTGITLSLIIVSFFIHWFSSRNKGILNVTDIFPRTFTIVLSTFLIGLKSLMVFTLFIITGFTSIPFASRHMKHSFFSYLFSIAVFFSIFELIPIARHFGFEFYLAAASVIAAYIIFYTKDKRTNRNDRNSRTFLFIRRKNSAD